MGPGSYASMADALLTDLRRNDPGALRRLRACVPRHSAATDASAAELRDARLIIAREAGFPTWRELMSFTEKSRRDLDERQEKQRRPQAEALLAGDTGRLAQLTAGQADTLLQMLATPEAIPGVSPDAAPYLGRTGLHWAIMHSQPEVARLLLERGADPSVRDELFQADADGWLHMFFATHWHDPVTQQLHDLIESRSR